MNFSKTISKTRTTQIFKILALLIIICACCIEGQTKLKPQSPDTSKQSVDAFLQNEINSRAMRNNSLEYNSILFSNSNAALDTSTIWLRTRMQLGELSSNDQMKSNFKASVINPLRQQFADMESMKAVKYNLATIQAGAVGYLAYEHIRKYGFLKKK